MLTIPASAIGRLESRHPGFRDQLMAIEAADLPACPMCGSSKTARVHFGIVQRTVDLAGATTKMKLLPNPPGPGAFFCHACFAYFDAPTWS